MGAPVMSFCRIDDQPIRTNEPVTEPDALIIQDPGLLDLADLFAGLGRDGYVLINSVLGLGELGLTNLARGYHRDRWLVASASPLAVSTLAACSLAPRCSVVRRADLGGQPGLGASHHRRPVLRADRGRKR